MKTMCNRTLAFFLCVLLLCGALPSISVAAAENTGKYGAMTYAIRSGEAVITDCAEDVTGTLVVPDSIEGFSVTQIDDCAFDDCEWLTEVVLPRSLQIIENCAFSGCLRLADLEIPENVRHIGESAFEVCARLTEIHLPKSVSNMGEHPFAGCVQLTRITVDEENARYCSDDGILWNKDKTSLIQYPSNKPETSFTVPDGVLDIQSGALGACQNLKTVFIPASVETIGFSALAYDQYLERITVDADNPFYSSDENGVLFDKEKKELIQYPCGRLWTSYEIPASVQTIGAHSFAYSPYLMHMVIPQSVREVQFCSFTSCSHLEYLHISSEKTQVDSEAMVSRGSASEAMDEIMPFGGKTTACLCAAETSEKWVRYAQKERIDFLCCGGEHAHSVSERVLPPSETDAPDIFASCVDECFEQTATLVAEQWEEAPEHFESYEFDVTGKNDLEVIKVMYSIRIVNDSGEVLQPPEGQTVTLRIPIPEGMDYTKFRICHVVEVTDQNIKTESFKWNPEEGSPVKAFTVSADEKYFIIEVSHFSDFLVYFERTPTIRLQDTKKTLSYGEKRTLTADAENLPDGGKIVWTADNDRVELTTAADGKTCEVSAKKSGKVTVSATVVDKDGDPVEQDGRTVSASVTLQMKAGFFHKLWYWLIRTPWPFG